MALPTLAEHVLSQSVQGVQARGLSGSTRSRVQPPPMEHMEPIAEEKSELAMDIAQAVVEKLDIDRKLDERMKELMLRGDRIFRDIQIRQEQSTEALRRSVGRCLESQRAFHEEHQGLLAAVRDLITMVAPFTPLAGQAMEAQTRAAEETETLRKQMEESRMATMASFSAAAALAQAAHVQSPTSPAAAALPEQTGAPAALQQGGTFNITLRKADEVSLGLSVNADEKEALIVENVLPGGAVESWNRQCFGDATGERVVVAGDKIVRVNGIEGDVKKMLEECTTQRLVKLVIARGPANAQTRANATIGGSGQTTACQAMDSSPTAGSTLRRKAPEFVPSGADATPLQQTQHLAAPPGLNGQHLTAPPGCFFPRPEDITKKPTVNSSEKMDSVAADAVVAGVVSQGYGENVCVQDVCAETESADKENH